MNVANRIALEPRFSGTYVAEQKKEKKKKGKKREKNRSSDLIVRHRPFIIGSVAYRYIDAALLSQSPTNRTDATRRRPGMKVEIDRFIPIRV